MQDGNDIFKSICTVKRGVDPQVLEQTIVLAVEIAREGREGRKIGALFVIGDERDVISSSKPLILDPLAGHSDDAKHISNPDLRETLKELAQLDGAFVISDSGTVVSAARYIDTTSDDLEVPLGLGSRHMAAASVSHRTRAVAVVVSESSMVRLFDDGELVSEITPELWMWNRYSSHLSDRPTSTQAQDDVTVVSVEE